VKGVYAVFLKLDEKRYIEVGALGEIEFDEGIYAYVGSAMNSAEKRIERHLSEVDNLHWHIDYFSAVAEPANYFILPEDSEYECIMADILSRHGDPIPGFGSSDCNCSSHLFRM